MTSLQESMFAHSSAALAEDQMELSTDLDRRTATDDDIDIDLDLGADLIDDEEDDYMIEDAASTTDQPIFNEEGLQAGHDDEMIDDTYTLQGTNNSLSGKDEEIEDAQYTVPDVDTSETFNIHPFGYQVSNGDLVTQDSYLSINDESKRVGDEWNHSPNEDAPFDFGNDDLDSNRFHGLLKGVATDGQAGDSTPSQDASGEIDEIDHSAKIDEYIRTGTLDEQQHPTEPIENDIYHQAGFAEDSPAAEQNITSVPDIEVLSASKSQDPMTADGTIADHSTFNGPYSASGHLQHLSSQAVIVIYEDVEMSLFPPTGQDLEQSQTYLLQDVGLIYESISILLESCRSVLAESISEHDELEITIEDLDLSVCETTKDSSTTTLAQVMDLHLQLQRLDGLKDTSPICIALSSKPRFSHRLDFLARAVVDGKGLSQVSTHDHIKEGINEVESDPVYIGDVEIGTLHESSKTATLSREGHEVEGNTHEISTDTRASTGNDSGRESAHSSIADNLSATKPNTNDNDTRIEKDTNLNDEVIVEAELLNGFALVNDVQEGDTREEEDALETLEDTNILQVADIEGDSSYSEFVQPAATEAAMEKDVRSDPGSTGANALPKKSLESITGASMTIGEAAQVQQTPQETQIEMSPTGDNSGVDDGDLIDYEEDEPTLQHSSSATSTVQGESSKLAMGTVEEDIAEEPNDVSHNNYSNAGNKLQAWADGNVYDGPGAAVDGDEAPTTREDGSADKGENDNNPSEVNEEEDLVDYSDEKLVIAIPANLRSYPNVEDQQLERTTSAEQSQERSTSIPLISSGDVTPKDLPHLDDDEITYEDGDEDEDTSIQLDQNGVTTKALTSSTLPSSASLKRSLDDRGEVDENDDHIQDAKRVRSNEKP